MQAQQQAAVVAQPAPAGPTSTLPGPSEAHVTVTPAVTPAAVPAPPHVPAPTIRPVSPRPPTNLIAPRLSTVDKSSDEEEEARPVRRTLAELNQSSSTSGEESSTEGKTEAELVRKPRVDIIRRPREVRRGHGRNPPAKGLHPMIPPCLRCVRTQRECWSQLHGISACWDCGRMKMKCERISGGDAQPAPEPAPAHPAHPAPAQPARRRQTSTRRRQRKSKAVVTSSDESSLAEMSDSEGPARVAKEQRAKKGSLSGSQYTDNMDVDVARPARVTRQQARGGQPAPAGPSRPAPAPAAHSSPSPPRLSATAKGKARGTCRSVCG